MVAEVQGLMQLARALPTLALRRVLLWMAMRAAEWRDMRGVPVGVVVPAHMNEGQCYERIGAALELIESAVPYRMRRMRKELRGVLCFGSGRDAALGVYVPMFRVCILDPRHVLNERVVLDDIARTILHEATHARLHQLGVRGATLGGRRIEALCVRAEQDYARKRSPSP